MQAEDRNCRRRELRRMLRDDIFSILGGKCVRCGFADPRALQIDHMSGGGHRDREEKGLQRSIKYYRAVLSEPENGMKDKYQLLCANCNWIRREEKGEYGGRTKRVKYVEVVPEKGAIRSQGMEA